MRGRNKVAAVLVAVLVVALLASWAFRHWRDSGNRDTQGPQGSGLERLWALVERQREESARAVASYKPTSTAQIGDLDASIVPLLEALPGVVKVEVLVSPRQRKQRIIHLRDWHHVPPGPAAQALRDSARKEGRTLTDAEVEAAYELHLLEVEAVQLQLAGVLRCLARHHGLQRVHMESLTSEEVPAWNATVEALREANRELIPSLHKQRAEAQSLLDGMTAAGREGTANYRQAQELKRQAEQLLEQHRRTLLGGGAPAWLVLDGELRAVLPLDDQSALEAADPLRPNGRVQFDKARVRARNDAHVRLALAQGPVALTVLGGAHNLAESVQRLLPRCEYLRVTTALFVQFAGE